MKNYDVMNLLNILYQRQSYSLNNNQLIIKKHARFNVFIEELYSNEFAKYFAPLAPI